MYQCKYMSLLILIFATLIGIVKCIHWDHSVYLNDDYRMLWTIKGAEITIEVQVKTLGYVGLGFSSNGNLSGADMAIGWIDQGKTYFQDRHVGKSGDNEPIMDTLQNYTLLLGYENATHTVIRFVRKLDTCDPYDIPITNDTMRVLFMYHDDEPRYGAIEPGSLPDPHGAFKGSRSLYFDQRPQEQLRLDDTVQTLELKNEDVELPQGDDTLDWCKMFKLTDFNAKQHLIKYEPLFESSASVPYIQHIILYECQRASPELELMSREQGRLCRSNPPMECNAIVATWSRGSEGFSFPREAGYPFDSNQARFYLMQTHYNNPDNAADFTKINNPQKADNSGLKLYFTTQLRKHDAGVISVGIDPNWRHLIPPGQNRVISEGHCVEECTRKSFPKNGINIFAVMMQTHTIGREIELQHIRGSELLPSVAHDNNIDADYQEFRRLSQSVRVLPGDRLVAKCIYDSSQRKAITLGGTTIREESCIVYSMYYPRQNRLTTCHSLVSLPTVLRSVGIIELAMGSNPVLILSPPELAGMTLESRLVSYDWQNQFDQFQQVTRQGSFRSICKDARNKIVPGTEYLDKHSITNLTKHWKSSGTSSSCPKTIKSIQNTAMSDDGDTSSLMVNRKFNTINRDMDNNEINDNLIEGVARTKVSRSSATETMGLSNNGNTLNSKSLLVNNLRQIVVMVGSIIVLIRALVL